MHLVRSVCHHDYVAVWKVAWRGNTPGRNTEAQGKLIDGGSGVREADMTGFGDLIVEQR